MKTIKLMAFLILVSITAAAQQTYGEIRGVLKNELKEKVSFATVKILQDNQLIGGTESDVEGNYKYKPLEPGLYDVMVIEAGHKSKRINGVKVVPGEATYLNIKMSSNTFGDVVVEGKLIIEDYTKTGAETNVYSMASLDATELMQNSAFERGGDLMSILPTLTSDVLEAPDGGFHFRGGRSDANAIFIDGVKALDMGTIPALSLENVTVFTGGVPAMYGDVMGGVIIVTTKSYFSGIREKNMRNRKMAEKRQEKKEKEEEEKEKASGVIFQ
ncbi:MAG: carboxypeptidase regulatory-like domain-containing protein [Bacteroidota bacterium]|nr:carboxypeptidase regulatory-like domain-containing protein [Bacteroidota bacterium]